MKNKDKYPDMEKAKEAYLSEACNPNDNFGTVCSFETWLFAEDITDQADIHKQVRDKVNKRDEANGYRVSRNIDESSNDWGSLRGIDISLRRIADVLEELNERIER